LPISLVKDALVVLFKCCSNCDLYQRHCLDRRLHRRVSSDVWLSEKL